MLKIVVATSLAALVTGFSTVPKAPMVGNEMIDEDEIEDPWNGWGGMPELDPEEVATWNTTAEEIEAKWAELVEDAPYQEVATAEEWAKGTTDEKKRWAALLIKVTDGPPADGVVPQRMVYASGTECDSDGLMDIQGAFKWYETPCSPSWTPNTCFRAYESCDKGCDGACDGNCGGSWGHRRRASRRRGSASCDWYCDTDCDSSCDACPCDPSTGVIDGCNSLGCGAANADCAPN